MKSPLARAPRVVDVKPVAMVTLEPVSSGQPGRGHRVRLVLRLSSFEPRFADREGVRAVATRALAAVAPGASASVGDVMGKVADSVVGIEGLVAVPHGADPPALGELRDVLVGAGYGVVAREIRPCSEDDCNQTAVVEWNRPDQLPAGWFGAQICGKHGYKACLGCGSTYVMSCTNATSSAPSVHCEVCGAILIEWGGTKVWTAELVSRGDEARS